jgi:hypothetical protein
MPFLLITADFPEIKPDELQEIYVRLESNNWLKLHDHSDHKGTTWFTSINYYRPLQEVVSEAKEKFTSLCAPYCQPKLAATLNANPA